MSSTSGHVFVSHGSENRDEAQELAAFLEARGVRIWIAPRDVRPGMDYSEQLQQAIEQAAAFVVLVTDHSNKSPYVRAETEMAFSTEKPIFPIRMSDIKPASGLALFLKIRHWTDAFGRDRDANLDRLARELQTVSGAEVQEGAPPPPMAAPPPSPPPPPPPHSPQPQPQAPAAAPAPLPEAGSPEEQKWQAAIGPKAPWYLERWRQMDSKGSAISWNWPACLLNVFWFAYRKMWLPLAGVLVALILVGMLTAGATPAVQLLPGIAISFVTGAFGNLLYRKQTAKLVAEASALPPDIAAQSLRSRGGVSVPALVVAIGITLLLVAAAIVVAAQQMVPQPAPPVPPDPVVNGTEGDKPSGGDEPGPAAGAFDPNDLVGRWADAGDCANATEFTADGRFLAPDGGGGVWTLEGDQLTLSGPGGTATIRVTALDRNSMTGVGPDGTVGTSQRC